MLIFDELASIVDGSAGAFVKIGAAVVGVFAISGLYYLALFIATVIKTLFLEDEDEFSEF